MTISKKLWLGFTTPLVILVGVAALAYWATGHLIETSRWVTHTHQVLTELEALLSTMKDAETGQRGYLLTDNEDYLGPYDTASANWERIFESLLHLTEDNRDQQRRLKDLRLELVAKFKELDQTISLRKKALAEAAAAKAGKTEVIPPKEPKMDAALAIVKADDGKRTMDQIRKYAREIRDAENELLKQREADAEANARLARLGILAGAAVAFLIVGLSGYLITRSITEPVRVAVHQLTSASAEILASTTEQNAGAVEQSAAVTQTMTTVTQVVQTSGQATLRAKGVGEAVQRTVEVGKTGRKIVGESIDALGLVHAQVESTAENILALAEQSQTIGEIIATVSDIAEQTNLLALNAAIEASRAGEHGKGFAVVASEVKLLAEQSKKATAHVRHVLGDIQKATNTAVLSTEEVTKGVAAAAKVATQAGEVITTLADTLAETAQAAAQIVASAGQQAAGMDQIQQAMKSIEQAARQNLAAMRQAEQAAHDLNKIGLQFSAFVGDRR